MNRWISMIVLRKEFRECVCETALDCGDQSLNDEWMKVASFDFSRGN
jgi:hypothetical protein